MNLNVIWAKETTPGLPVFRST